MQSKYQALDKSLPTLVLFDFDGTLTCKDSFPDFLKFAMGRTAFYLGLLRLSPLLVTYKLRIISNHSAKEKVISYFLGGWDIDEFQTIADRYSASRIARIVRPNALKTLRRHQERGHNVVVVSASIESWLRNWCQTNDLDLIATQLEVRNGRLTGRFATKNCYGAEKVSRILERFDLNEFGDIYAYGDSRGDREMLAVANRPFHHHFSRFFGLPAIRCWFS